MFINCPHCRALVATDPASDLPPERCPRCAAQLRIAASDGMAPETAPAPMAPGHDAAGKLAPASAVEKNEDTGPSSVSASEPALEPQPEPAPAPTPPAAGARVAPAAKPPASRKGLVGAIASFLTSGKPAKPVAGATLADTAARLLEAQPHAGAQAAENDGITADSTPVDPQPAVPEPRNAPAPEPQGEAKGAAGTTSGLPGARPEVAARVADSDEAVLAIAPVEPQSASSEALSAPVPEPAAEPLVAESTGTTPDTLPRSPASRGMLAAIGTLLKPEKSAPSAHVEARAAPVAPESPVKEFDPQPVAAGNDDPTVDSDPTGHATPRLGDDAGTPEVVEAAEPQRSGTAIDAPAKAGEVPATARTGDTTASTPDPDKADPVPAPAAAPVPAPATPVAVASPPAKPAPSFVHGGHAAPGSAGWKILAAIAALAGLLLLQLLLADRAQLAADARWRPLLTTLCGALRCSLPPWREPAAFVVLARSVSPHPSRPDALRVTATFRNDARWPQPWPRLRLTLSDVNGKPVAARDFSARDYLGAVPTQNELASGQSATIALDVREPAARSVAFDFELL